MKCVRSLHLSFFLVNCCLILLLAACDSTATGVSRRSTPPVQKTIIAQSHSRVVSNQEPSQRSLPVAVPTLPVHIDCPANGSSRAALLRPEARFGEHPALIYISNEFARNTAAFKSILKRYDIATGRTYQIFVNDHSIGYAQISADGQWVLFLSQNGASGARLQLVRIDGANLQTLYCASSSVTISGIYWSADQKNIFLNMLDSNTNTSTLALLNTTTGTLQTELQTPIGARAYKAITWLDNTRLYVAQGLNQVQTAVPPALYLLDVTKNKDIHGANLKRVSDFPMSGGTMDLESSADKSLDGKTLFMSHCFSNGSTLTSDITVQPVTGGQQHVIYQNMQGCIKDLRSVSATRLLFTMRIPDRGTGRQVLMTVRTDGSRATTLYNNGAPHVSIELNRRAPLPWSNVSRDGHLYAFNEQGAMVGVSNLLLGSFSGGKPTKIVSNSSGSVSTVGWTTF